MTLKIPIAHIYITIVSITWHVPLSREKSRLVAMATGIVFFVFLCIKYSCNLIFYYIILSVRSIRKFWAFTQHRQTHIKKVTSKIKIWLKGHFKFRLDEICVSIWNVAPFNLMLIRCIFLWHPKNKQIREGFVKGLVSNFIIL